jgi:hypothetical protein
MPNVKLLGLTASWPGVVDCPLTENDVEFEVLVVSLLAFSVWQLSIVRTAIRIRTTFVRAPRSLMEASSAVDADTAGGLTSAAFTRPVTRITENGLRCSGVSVYRLGNWS